MNFPSADSDARIGTSRLLAEDPNQKALLRIFLACILVWSLDYKSATSGSGAAIQGLILGVFVLGSFLLIISALWRGIGVGPVWVLIAAIVLFLVESSVVGVLNDQDLYAIFVNTIPSLILACTSAITYMTLVSLKGSEEAFLNALRYACLVFVVVHLAIVVLTRGSINLSDSRYEVLSAATTPALAIIAVGFLKRLSKLDIAIFVMNLFVSVLSVTRTLLLVLALQLFAVIVARPRTILQPLTIKAASAFAVAIMLVLAVDLSAGTGIADRWVERITVSKKAGADPTSLTRKAEVRFMMAHFEESPETVLFGNGLAAQTSLTGPEARLAAQLVGASSVYFHSSGFGHENYVSILFIAGILGGGSLLFLLFWNGVQGFMFLRHFKLTELNEAQVHLGLWGALIVIGTLAVGFFGGILGDRDLTVWYGIGTGMLYWARDTQSSAANALNAVAFVPHPPESPPLAAGPQPNT